MDSTKRKYIAIFQENKAECLQIILWGWVKNIKIHVISPAIISGLIKTMNRIPFIKGYVKKSIVKNNLFIADYKGLWYEISKETIDLTIKFYNEKLKHTNKIINYYNRLFNTDKFAAYIKQQLSLQIYAILKDLHLIRQSRLIYGNILISKNPVNQFVIAYMERKYGIKYQIKWVVPITKFFSLFMYYGWLLIEFMKRGIVFNKTRKNYKLAMEAVWGFYRKTLRNDILVDNVRIKPKDILILKLLKTNAVRRNISFKEAKERGFDTASLPELKINITKSIFTFLSFYFLIPAKIFLWLFLEKISYLSYYVLLFHKRSFSMEVLFNLYDIKCYISMCDWGGIEETIISNKYGTKSAIFHWSDFTSFHAYDLAFSAHNVFFAWGDIHYDFHSNTSSVDEKINIGCIFKKESNKVSNNKEDVIAEIDGFRREGKVVTFYDSGFSKTSVYDERFFLEYIEIIKEFCERHKDVNVLLKPKALQSYESRLSTANQDRYKSLWNELTRCSNFNYLDPYKWSIENAIAISDVSVSMGMNSPSTIALICGKDALYFDNTGNVYHPFSRKYKDIIMFDNKDLLAKQISNILNGKFNCKDVISEEEIREYDAFSDDNALDRLREKLYELTLSHKN